ncbi:MAG TPA: tRNA (N(6)-L-threonylcarbamoyladenosine(37)-C(2))-methylthiotransferase MtaB [Firmicutes bacterium]|jgi:threonylcarbamoyladenosine tRNA methylthiotransferase MtaB|nr:tRNA (N(6)-L-threonylcarbamoyladenosine(37)-C(2))-methylthiotransferase MtaB [Bacillota bacterium]
MLTHPVILYGKKESSGPSKRLRVAFTTLGCKVNVYDTEMAAEQFRRAGYQVVDFDQPADVYVINTCSVTNMGARKSRQMIRRAVNSHPEAVIVAMGCYSQYAPDEVEAIAGVDVLLGTQGRKHIVELVEAARQNKRRVNAVGTIMAERQFEELDALHFEGRTRAVLKVQDGCNEFCSYCQIPWARGRNRSRLPERVIEQVRGLVRQGFPEIVLTGVHVGTYGEDLSPKTSLAALLREVAQIPGVERLRLSSIDPHEVTDELIEVMSANASICHHLHIPAQSGEDGVLAAMRRRNTVQEYRKLVAQLRREIPDIAITTDIIAGFPGESEESFQQTLAFCREMKFNKIHAFPYSRRKGTKADAMPGHLPRQVKQERARRLIALSDELALEHHQALLDQTVTVLVEQPSDYASKYVQGLTDTYVRVHLPGDGLEPGDFVQVRIVAAMVESVVAVIL